MVFMRQHLDDGRYLNIGKAFEKNNVPEFIIKDFVRLYDSFDSNNQRYFACFLSNVISMSDDEWVIKVEETEFEEKVSEEILDLLDGWIFTYEEQEATDYRRMWHCVSLCEEIWSE